MAVTDTANRSAVTQANSDKLAGKKLEIELLFDDADNTVKKGNSADKVPSSATDVKTINSAAMRS